MHTIDWLQQLAAAVTDGDKGAAVEKARAALAAGIEPIAAIEGGLRKGIEAIGDRFGRGEAFLPELVMAAAAMQAGLQVFRPLLKSAPAHASGKGLAVIGSVAGDVHDIGKNIVAALWEAHGFTVINLGVDISDQTFVQKVAELKPHILGLSALMTTTMLRQKAVIEALRESGLRDRIKIMVGGAVVTSEWAHQIGADAYGADAVDAVRKAEALLR